LSKRKPIIGISGNIMLDTSGRFDIDYWKSYVNEDYVTSVLKAGGVPVIMPMVDDEEVLRAQVENVDAVVFTGGDADVSPDLYGEEILPKTQTPCERRDWFDMKLAKIVKELKKPTLFVCRGHQIANVFHGGSLYQDLSYAEGINLEHNQFTSPCFLAHEVNIKKQSLLYEIVQKESISVNSFHHQVIKDVPESLNISAIATDGAIEAIELKDPDCFFLSLQWHPEMLAARDDEDMLNIFKRLVKETKI